MRSLNISPKISPPKLLCYSSNSQFSLNYFLEINAKKKVIEDQSAKFLGPLKVLPKLPSPTR
jgi:hypothetical protein